MSASAVTPAIRRSVDGGNGHRGFLGDGGEGSPDPRVPERVYVTGMLIALGAILMFFAALISAWVVRRGFPNTDWQPIALPRILWLNTLILLASSATLVRSRRALIVGGASEFRHWWRLTTILGVLFVVGQLIAWRQMFAAGFFLATNPNSSFFYVFTAAHALHVLGGIAALLVIGFRSRGSASLRTGVRIVAVYWHFLSALWLVILVLLMAA